MTGTFFNLDRVAIKYYRIANYPLIGIKEPMTIDQFYPGVLEFHTGTYDRNNIPIFEGDTLRQMSCEIPFVVEDIVSFLIMCGRYEEKHGAPIFDSLEIVNG